MAAIDTELMVGDLGLLVPDFERALRAANKSPKTIKIYSEFARGMIEYFVSVGMPTDTSKIKGEHAANQAALVQAPENLNHWLGDKVG